LPAMILVTPCCCTNLVASSETSISPCY
jgi:hypothetical protein